MRKHAKCLALVLLLMGLLVTSGAAASPGKGLSTPKLIEPKNGATLSVDQVWFFLWDGNADVNSYYIFELEKGTDRKSVMWTSVLTMNQAWFVEGMSVAPFEQDPVLEPGYYRWRVIAETVNPPTYSKPSKWRTFTAVE